MKMQAPSIQENLNSSDSVSPTDNRVGPSRLKRVLFAMALDPTNKFGSLEEQVLVQARAFRERGGLFLPVFTRPLDAEAASQYASEGIQSETLDMKRFDLATFQRLLGLIRQNQIEVVHWSFYHPLSNHYVWALSVFAPRIEHFYTDHISRPAAGPTAAGGKSLKQRLKALLNRRYRKIVCVSDYVLSQRTQMTRPRPERIHHFINTQRFRPDPVARQELRQTLGVGEEFVLVLVAHLIKEKGVDVALRALTELPGDVHLWIVGQGPEKAVLESQAREAGLESRVRFVGPQRYVQPYMQAADCALCPSLWAEAAGLVNLEAPSCGLPVIASRIGGIPELIEDGCNGYLFTAGDHRELAERILRLVRDPQKRQAMGQQARLRVVDRHSEERLLGDYLGLYEAGLRKD